MKHPLKNGTLIALTAALRREGWVVNPKRVYRLLREDNLLCLRKRKFVVTTDSNHKLEIYLNLAKRMELTGVDQLWVADITYIRLHTEFVYLALILDNFSRKVVGWNLGRTLSSRLAIKALEQAIDSRQPAPGLVQGQQIERGGVPGAVVRGLGDEIEVSELSVADLVHDLARLGVAPVIPLRSLVSG